MILLAVIALIGLGGWQLLVHPRTPLAREWNPLQPLRIADPVTSLTPWKLRQTAEDGAACRAALSEFGAEFTAMPDLEVSETCAIQNRGSLSGFPGVRMDPVETRCAIALRTAMWVEHSLGPAAERIIGSPLTGLDHLSSYNCRAIRTPGGGSGRPSLHATAEAIDISGFRFADGTRIRLTDWDAAGPAAAYLRAARDAACRFFATTLGPNYNRLHADHFHLQSRGWGTCR